MVLNPAGSPVNPGNPNNVSDASSGANPQALLDAYKTGNGLPPGETSMNPADPNATLMFGSNNTSLPVKPNTAATTYPVVTSGAATTDVNNMQNTANGLSGQVAGQQVSIAQNKAATAANTQGGQTDTSGTQQGSTDQNTSPTGATNDNSDLTNALSAATNAITPPDQAGYKQEQTLASQQEADLNNKLTDVSNQTTTAYNQFQGLTTQLLNGTFPLSPTQQGQVQQMQSAYQGLIQATQLSSQNYINGVRSFGVTSGLDMYSPVMALQAINSATQDANAKVATAEVDASKALSDLQNSFQTQDFNIMSKSYDALNNALDSKSKALTSLLDNVQKQAQQATTDYNDQVKEYQTQVQNAVSNAFKSQTLTDTEKKNVFDEMMQSANFTEKQKQDAADNYYKGLAAQNAIDRLKLDQEKVDQTNTENDAAVTNNTKTSSQGLQYIDATNMSSAELADAQQKGLPIVKGKDAQVLDSISAAKQDIQAIQDYVAQFLPKDASGRIVTGPKDTIQKYLQTDDQLAAYSSMKANALTILSALQGTATGTRMNQSLIKEIETLSVPSLSDTVGKANQSFQNFNNTFNSSENSILVNNKSLLPGGANAGGYSAVAPDGKTYYFKSSGDLNTFKQKAGIK